MPWYYITVTRKGQTFYVISPKWHVYELSLIKEKNTYLWDSKESAEADKNVTHLFQPGDEINYVRTYKG